MHILTKSAYVIGLSMGIGFFILFLISVVPNTLNNAYYDWEEINRRSLDPQVILDKIESTDTVKEFKLLHPNATMNFQKDDHYYTISQSNFELQQTLTLNVSYYDGSLRYVIECYNFLTGDGESFDNSMALSYIKANHCLEEPIIIQE